MEVRVPNAPNKSALNKAKNLAGNAVKGVGNVAAGVAGTVGSVLGGIASAADPRKMGNVGKTVETVAGCASACCGAGCPIQGGQRKRRTGRAKRRAHRSRLRRTQRKK